MRATRAPRPADGPPPRSRAARAGVAVLAALAVAGASLLAAPAASADTAPPAGVPATVSADPLPTTQIDGVVWTQTAVGSTVYVGGEFKNARPAGAAPQTQLTPRANLLAYNLQTGALVAGWNPGTNGTVLATAASPDGTRLYVAGTFTTVGGKSRSRVAAFDTATGALLDSWQPVVNGKVIGLAATASTVYLAGEFTQVNSVGRTKVAAVNASTGGLLPFNPTLAGGWGARSVVVSPDGGKVVVAGSFTSVNGSTNPGRGMAALGATSAQILPWAVNATIRNAGENAAVYALSSDGDSVYGTGYDFNGGTEDGFEGAFRADWADGTTRWIEDCHGDTYGVAPLGDAVYVASHSHYCGNVGGFPESNPRSFSHSLAFSKAPTGQKITADPHGYRSFTGQQAPTPLTWYPKWTAGSYTGQQQAGWDVEAAGGYLLYGGEFTAVAGSKQQGLVRFAVKESAPNKIGPSVQGGAWKLNATSVRAGTVRLSWTANYDADNERLTYQLFRQDKGTTPVYQVDAPSTFWRTPTMTATDTTVTNGQAYRYRIRATDAWGNTTQSDWLTVTPDGTATATAYDDAVLADAPRHYWPLGEASGGSGLDWAGGDDLTVTDATRAVTGPLTAGASTATRFAGTTSSAASTRAPEPAAQQLSLEAWFRTTSTDGGKIAGFGSSATGASSSYDRHLYLGRDGRLTFGVYPGSTRTLTTPDAYNDGAWHHVVATLGADGQVLYVDGRRVGRDTSTTSGQDYSGYWRVGGDNVDGWPGSGGRSLQGDVAGVAVYPQALTRDQVVAHWVASGRTTTLPPVPADAYGQAVSALDPELFWRLGEASGTTAADSGPNGSEGRYAGDVTLGRAGAIAGLPDTAAAFAPQTVGGTQRETRVSSVRSYANPTTYALEAWFSTTTTAGGKIIGFGDRASGLSSNYDRHVYMTTDGRLNFGAYTGSTQVVTSPAAYNDGQWHHVVAQQSAAGMQLFVDGAPVASNGVTGAQSYTGYWRVGGDSSWSGAAYFTGTIDEVAVYSAPLTADQVADHHALGLTGAPNVAPTAAFTTATADLAVQVDGSGSADPDGTVVSYAWDFGDGGTGTGVTAAHTYAAAGTYVVRLTVVDDRGGSATAEQPVTVTPPNAAPVAAFGATATGLTVALDGRGSTDADGTVAAYAWEFGDGTTGTGATASHTYAAAGSYAVTLTVTDDDGATGAVTQTVQVVAPPAPGAIATDEFERTSPAGWGTADLGGAWTHQGANAAFSVADGAGRMTFGLADTRAARLTGVQATAVDVQAQIAVDRTGPGYYASVIGRQVGSDAYTARVRFEANGAVRLYALRNETALGGSFVMPGAPYAPGDQLMVRVQVTGTAPTTVSAKVWRVGEAEPAAWQVQGTDTTAALQVPGSVGLISYLSGSSATPTATLSVASFRATTPAP